jgi:soluble lytic murein transglycosylase
MKRMIIASLVLMAGGASMFGILGADAGRRPMAPADNTPPLRPISLKSDRVAALPKPVETVAPDSDDITNAISPIETEDLQPSETFRAGLRALARRDSIGAMAERDRLPSASNERLTLTWAIAVSGQRAVPAAEMLEARTLLRGWPAIEDINSNIENALLRENAPAQVVLDFMRGGEPRSADGVIMLARALKNVGRGEEAKALVRSAWKGRVMKVEDEDRILSEFGTELTATDHLRRMKYLLYADQYARAARFASPAKAEPLATAFSAIGRRAKDSKTLLEKARAEWGKDPTFLYLQIRRLRQTSQYEAAAKLLARMPDQTSDLVDPGKWWVETRIVSRGLIDLGQPAEAYKLAIAHRLDDGEDRAEAEFHAGWYALRGMGKPKMARPHFEQLLLASNRAHDQARGYYWLGRTDEALGDKDKARVSFERAASHPTTFYGQLAEARLGLTNRPLGTQVTNDGALIDFANRPQIRALSLLKQSGEDGRARRLYLSLARFYGDQDSLQMLSARALTDYGPSLALAIGKAAQNQGHDPGLAAYPLGAIPETADIDRSARALTHAIARQESAFNPQAVSHADARGLLQILPSTARKVAERNRIAWVEEKLLADPAYNATLGSRYLDEQIQKFNGSLVLTFAAYNAGPNRIPDWIGRYGDPRRMPLDGVVDWIEHIPFQETRNYVQRVMENYQVYKRLLSETANIASDLTINGRPLQKVN